MDERAANIVKPSVILLDVYETLLDMSDVEVKVNHLTDSIRGYTLWFELFMQYCFVDNCTGQFNDFASIARATLQMTAKKLGTSINDDDVDELLEMLKHLPVHDGVQEGLSLLSNGGYRIAALTNSPQKIVLNRMERTGLISYFETVLSSEQIKKYKPCTEVYEWAGKELEVSSKGMLLVSAHEWDIAGGANAGMQTVYMKKGKQVLYPLAPKPDFICKNLSDLPDQLGVTAHQ
jgi:2-haloacid dehalogenase